MLARLAILAVAATLAASACTGATTSPSAPTTSEAPATEAPGSAAPASGSPAAAPAAPVNPYVETGAVPGSGAGKKIGYISLGEQVPFAVLVSNGIKEQAEIAGLELVFCDSKLDTPTALACAQQFAVQGVQGVLNFHVDETGLSRDLRGLRQRPDDRHRHHPAAVPGRLLGRQQPRGRPPRRCSHRQVRQGDVGLRVRRLRVARVGRRQGSQRRPHGRLSRRLPGVLPDHQREDPAGRRPHRQGHRHDV